MTWAACRSLAIIHTTLVPLPCLILSAEVAALRQHREWADRRIAQLIRRVGDAERPARQEAARLLEEVQALRVRRLEDADTQTRSELGIWCARMGCQF